MAVGLQVPARLSPIAGIRLGAGVAGVRRSDREDLALVLCDPGTRAAACFTRNRFQAASVIVARRHLAARPEPRALVINSGNANAGTGADGIDDAHAICRAVATDNGFQATEVLPFSTGVIGERLPSARIIEALPGVAAGAQAEGWLAAARAIMTTDTVPKGASRSIEHDGATITLTGIAKGSGMIRPDMATMLAFVATDASVPTAELQICLNRAIEQTFHRITIDGDTSTNDACVLLATGRKGEVHGQARERFQHALTDLCRELAQAVVRDAEGATKFVEVAVTGAAGDEDARQVAMTVAHSPLVKTALFASDANWGRILAAVGRAPVADLDPAKLSLDINGVSIIRAGAVAPDYREAQGATAMANEEILIAINLGIGPGTCSVWTSDLSHGYITINAEYRT